MKKRIIYSVAIIFSVALFITGAVAAWFTAQTGMENSFTAGTVSIEADSSSVSSLYFDPSEAVYIYGVEQGTGDLYEVNLQNQSSSRIFDTPDLMPGNPNSPNGLAFDRGNQRLYFAVYSAAASESELYFYDLKSKDMVYAGTVDGVVAGSTFGRGCLWYIRNATDHLYKVTFDLDGKVDQEEFVAAITAGQKSFRFGDIAFDIRSNVLYGSSLQSGTTDPEFFKYNLVTGDYQMISQDGAIRLQLAFGSDGSLYGHSTGSRHWYQIDGETGSANYLFTGQEHFTDLASGYLSTWNPGDCSEEVFRITNTGTKNAYIRADFSGAWYEYDEILNDWILWNPDPPDLSVVTVNIADSDWEYLDGFYYYNNVVAGTYYGVGGVVEVKVKVCLDGPKTDNQFQGKRYILTARFEAIQSTHDASTEKWGWSP